MKNFNFSRFCQVLKWTVISEKKSIFTAFIAFTVAFLGIQLFSCFTISDISYSLGHAATRAGMGFCIAILGFAYSYYVSGVQGNARTTQQRTTALMLPASNLEKFTARIAYCCLFMLLLLYLAALAATCLRVLLEWMAGHHGIIAGLDQLFGIGRNNGHDFTTLSIIAGNCWFISLYVLGGMFFRKHPFVWTTVTLFAGCLLLFTIIFYVIELIGKDTVGVWLASIFYNVSEQCFFNIVSIVLLGFTVLNVWLSYRLFCRLQVVQHKWFNV